MGYQTIAIEGIDGSGGETQTKLLVKHLRDRNIRTALVSYPDYDGPFGRIIRRFLDGKIDLTVENQFYLYAADMIKDTERIKELLLRERTIVFNRYFNSTIAYQTTKGYPIEDALTFAQKTGMIVPGVVIFLDISPETSLRRKYGEGVKLDRHERDQSLLKKVRENYQYQSSHKIFGKNHFLISAEADIQTVQSEIRRLLGV